jgi:hypothetical protein
MTIGFICTRLAGTAGATLETIQWALSVANDGRHAARPRVVMQHRYLHSHSNNCPRL